ncbi:agmatinase, mitochondrial-like [Sinocyclocheilus grahami]|uniref:agmatinase, mitochondrial-like n=1 Tax=Sinocyclocheilus grahami TaxID=75366 RepID=UPI0007ACFA57|nr:PREDICTED: agmatinase, mitochondrial-like [Sinocyclocheilus grahami]
MLSSIKIVSKTRAVFGGSRGFKACASQTLVKQGNFDGDQSNASCTRRMSGNGFNVPPSAEFVARVSGIATMCKLPFQKTAHGLDAAFVGVPIDTGTSNRPGASLALCNMNTQKLYLVPKPGRSEILLFLLFRHGPVGLIHVDAHADTSDMILGEKIGHGTPFRRCVDEGLLDCKRVVQIGLRGSGYSPDNYEWSRAQGFRVVEAVECWHKSLVPLMEEVRSQMGTGPVYLSFDIDSLDPAFAPGTGTPEIAGLTPIQGLEIIRGCRGVNLVGCDLVEVSPPYDTTGR